MTDTEVTFTDVAVTFRGRRLETKRAILASGAIVTKLGGHSLPVRYYFSYAGRELEFLFIASRWTESIQLDDTWEVAFDLYELSSAQKAEIAAAVVELQADIRTALLAWPPGKAEARVPAKSVRFLP